MATAPWRVWLMLAAPLLAGACVAPSGSGYHFADIPPRWEMRNSPVPVPRPVMKPPPPAPPAIVARAAQDVPAIARQGAITVRPGDTLYALSRRSGHDVGDLIAANGLQAPYRLHPGQRLRLPVARWHVVARGETGYGISRAYGIDVASLMRMNDIGPPYHLSVGQKLRLPAVAWAEAKARPQPAPQAVAADFAPADAVVALKASGAGFAWPVEGRVVSRFGPKEGGFHNDGINIAAPRGAPVRAARDGDVVYAGAGLKGFGNLILIRHSFGWITAYAHNELLLVAKGARVRQGELIARAGATGAAASPQLHFEIREGRRAVNPEQYLPRLVSMK